MVPTVKTVDPAMTTGRQLPIAIGQLICEECGDGTHHHEEGYGKATHGGHGSTNSELEVWQGSHSTNRAGVVAGEM